jgi:hypothetical protein
MTPTGGGPWVNPRGPPPVGVGPESCPPPSD